MKEKLTLQNTYCSFTPSFLGSGWEMSLSPRFERTVGESLQTHIVIKPLALPIMLLKMLFGLPAGRHGRRKEEKSWTTAIARLLL